MDHKVYLSSMKKPRHSIQATTDTGNSELQADKPSFDLPKRLILFVGLFITLSTLSTSYITPLRLTGFLSLISLLATSYLLFIYIMRKTPVVKKELFTLWIIAAVPVIIYLFALIQDDLTLRGVKNTAELLVIIISFSLFSHINWTEKEIRLISIPIAAYIFLGFMVFILEGFPFQFKFLSGNSNSFSAFMFLFLFFTSLRYLFADGRFRFKKMLWGLVVLMNLILIFAGHARSVWLSLLTCTLTYLLWNIISHNKTTFHAFFWVIAILILIFPLVYVYLYTNSNASVIWNEVAKKITGKVLFSGRQWLWVHLIDLISRKPILGYGAGAVPGKFLPTHWSSHNLYLQIALQTGLVGVFFTMLLLFQIWKGLYRGKEDLYVRLSGSFLIAFLVHQSFEVALTQNNLSIGILMWLIMSIGFSRATGKTLLGKQTGASH